MEKLAQSEFICNYLRIMTTQIYHHHHYSHFSAYDPLSLVYAPHRQSNPTSLSTSTLQSVSPSANLRFELLNRTEKQIEEEFKTLPNSLVSGATALGQITEYREGLAPRNTLRNRYDNVIANDSTRVKLKHSTNDYINANYCLGKSVILTQGPSKETIGDFFQMLWQTSSTAICMVTPWIEKEKERCTPYLSATTTTFGSYNVYMKADDAKTTEELKEHGISLSRIVLTKKELSSKFQFIRHYHVSDWPDNEATSAKTVAVLVRFLLQETMPVIHCSGGVGRSGTVALVLGAYKSGRTLKEELTLLRKERRGCVQTSVQYYTAHQALKILLSQDTT